MEDAATKTEMMLMMQCGVEQTNSFASLRPSAIVAGAHATNQSEGGNSRPFSLAPTIIRLGRQEAGWLARCSLMESLQVQFWLKLLLRCFRERSRSVSDSQVRGLALTREQARTS